MECDRAFATIKCPQCSGDVFCDDCHKLTHSKGHLHTHDIVRLQPWVVERLQRGQVHCVECNLKAATLVCDACDDAFCKTCFKATHSIGQRLKHTCTPWDRSLKRYGWQEEWDKKSERFVFVNQFTDDMRSTKPAKLLLDFKLGKNAMVRQQFMNVLVAKDEQRIRELQEGLKHIETKEKEVKKDILVEENRKKNLDKVDLKKIRKKTFKPKYSKEMIKKLETKELKKLLASDYERSILSELDGKRDNNFQYSHLTAKKEIVELSTKAPGIEDLEFGAYDDLDNEEEIATGKARAPYKDTFSSWIDRFEHREWLD